jgi:hypothetical protein
VTPAPVWGEALAKGKRLTALAGRLSPAYGAVSVDDAGMRLAGSGTLAAAGCSVCGAGSYAPAGASSPLYV